MKKITNKQVTRKDTTIENLNRDINELESSDAIKFGEAVKRLKENDDFKLVFEQEFFKDYPLRVIRLKTDPAVILSEMSDNRLKSFDDIITASGIVQTYLLQISAKYTNTLSELDRLKDTLRESKRTNIKKG